MGNIELIRTGLKDYCVSTYNIFLYMLLVESLDALFQHLRVLDVPYTVM